MIYNNRPNRSGGMFMCTGPNPYMRPGNMKPLFRRSGGGMGLGQPNGPGYSHNMAPFDLLKLRSTFESYNEEAGLNEALSRRLNDLTPSEDEIKVLESFVSRIVAGIQTLIDDPTSYPGLDLEEVKVIGAFKKGTMLSGDRKAKVLLKTRNSATRVKLAELVRLLPQVCQAETKPQRKIMCAERPYGLILKETDTKAAKRTQTALAQSAAAGLDGFIQDTDDGFGDFIPNVDKPVESGAKPPVKLVDSNALWMEICVAVAPKKRAKKGAGVEKPKGDDGEETTVKDEVMEGESESKEDEPEGDEKQDEESPEKPEEEESSTKPILEVIRWRQRKSLTESRRFDWLAEKATDPTVNKLIRLLTDLSQRFSAFNYLIKDSMWPVELLAYFCVCPSHGSKRNTAASKLPNLELGPALRRCLQLLSGGLFLPGGFNIHDPTHFGYAGMSNRLYLRMNLKQLDELSTMAHLLMRLLIGYGLFDIVFCNTDYKKPGEFENLLAIASARTGILIQHGEEVITEADMAARFAERSGNDADGEDGKLSTKRRSRGSMGDDDDDDDDSGADELNCSAESLLDESG